MKRDYFKRRENIIPVESVAGSSIERSSNYPYQSPTPGQLPIVATTPWREIVDGKRIPPTQEDFDGVAACGFNTALISSPILEYNRLGFDYAAENGMSGILQQYSYTENEFMMDFVEKLKCYSNLKGYLLWDEPKYHWLIEQPAVNPNLNPNKEDPFLRRYQVREMYDWLKKNDPSKMVYMNFPYTTTIDSGENKNAEDAISYVDFLQFVEDNFRPALWCYDFYPIIQYKKGVDANGDPLYNVPEIRPQFYLALEEYADISRKTSRPFWAHCMCVAHDRFGDGENIYPTPTEGHLRFEAFMALAYGAQCLVYYYYAQRPNKNDYSAPIDLNGNRTEIWYNVQAINREIRKYQEVFLGCTVVSKFFRDTSKTGEDGIKALRVAGPVDNVTSPSKGVLVSHITNNGYNYLVIVSKDPFDSQEITVTFQSNYLERYIVFEMTPNFIAIGSIMPDGSSALERKVKLVAGGYAILRWTTK